MPDVKRFTGITLMPNIKDHIAIKAYESPEEYRKRLLRNSRKNSLLRDPKYIDMLVAAAQTERKKVKSKRVIAARAKMFDPEYTKLRDDMRYVMRSLTNQRYYCARTNEQEGIDFCNEYMRVLRKTRTVMKTRQADGLEPRHWSELLDKKDWREVFRMYDDMMGSLARRFRFAMDKARNFEGYDYKYRREDPRVAEIAATQRVARRTERIWDTDVPNGETPRSVSKGEER